MASRKEAKGGGRGTKTVEITLAARVDADASAEDIAGEVARALKPLSSRKEDVSEVVVRTVSRQTAAPGDAGGYESRIWGKATCKSPKLAIDVTRDRDPLAFDEIDILRKQVADLAAKTKDLEAKVGGR